MDVMYFTLYFSPSVTSQSQYSFKPRSPQVPPLPEVLLMQRERPLLSDRSSDKNKQSPKNSGSVDRASDRDSDKKRGVLAEKQTSNHSSQRSNQQQPSSNRFNEQNQSNPKTSDQSSDHSNKLLQNDQDKKLSDRSSTRDAKPGNNGSNAPSNRSSDRSSQKSFPSNKRPQKVQPFSDRSDENNKKAASESNHSSERGMATNSRSTPSLNDQINNQVEESDSSRTFDKPTNLISNDMTESNQPATPIKSSKASLRSRESVNKQQIMGSRISVKNETDMTNSVRNKVETDMVDDGKEMLKNDNVKHDSDDNVDEDDSKPEY